MTDIVERAEYFLKWNQVDTSTAHDLVRDLTAELKTARAENGRLLENCHQWRKLFDEVTGITPDDVALLRKLADQ